MNRRGFLAGVGGAVIASPAILSAAETVDLEKLNSVRFIAIGERHDNSAHHLEQAALVRKLKPTGLAFEMIPQDQEDTVNQMRREGASVADMQDLLEREAPGWDWTAYLSIIASAEPETYIAGGSLSKADLGSVYEKGARGLGSELTARYGLDEPVPEAVLKQMLDQQYFAHCEMIEREKLGAMLEVQRAWDAAYAEAWLRAARRGGGRSVLICGNVHARLDRGAPAALMRAEPTATVASVGMLEDGEPIPEGHFTTTHFSPAPEREDQCERMRRAMEKKG